MSSRRQEILKQFDDTKLEALVELLYIAAYADGEFSAEERKHFCDSIELLTDKRLKATTLDALLERIQRNFKVFGRGGRLRTVKERLGDVGPRRAAMMLVVQLMASDGLLRTSEREIIPEIADALGLDRSFAADEVNAFFKPSD